MPQQTPDLFAIGCEVAIAAAASADGDKLPSFSMLAYSGGPMMIAGFGYPVVVALAGLKIPAQQRPVRFQHSSYQGVGHTTRIAIENGKLTAEGLISRDTPAAREVIASGKKGFPWQASIGASIEELEFVGPGSKAEVNGRSFAGPVYVALKTTLTEISFVDLGADQKTRVKIAAQHGKESTDMPPLTPGTEMPETPATPVPTTVTATAPAAPVVLAAPVAPVAPVAPAAAVAPVAPAAIAASTDAPAPEVLAASSPLASIEQIAANARAESTRREGIAGIVTEILAEHPALADVMSTLGTAAIEAHWDVQKFQLEAMRHTRGYAGVGGPRRDTQMAPSGVIEAALCMAGGLGTEQLDKQFDERTLEAANRKYRHGIGLGETLLIFAQANGYRGHGSSDLKGLLQHAFNDIQAAGASTMSLPGILSNVANKFLREGFDAVESAYRDIAATRPVRDFKAVSSFSLTGGFVYEEVGPGGELKHAQVGEVEYTNQAKTYGRMFGIDRRDLINDDLDALTAVPRRLGRGAALKLNDVFWGIFLNNAAFFTTGRKNYLAGAGTAFGIDALTDVETMFFDQVDPDGHPLAVSPSILLVPNALSVPATQLMHSTEVRPASDSVSQQPVSNPHAGKFRIVRSSYLSNAKYVGASALAYYVLADPKDMPIVEIAYLNGQEQPIIESADADFNQLGIQMRGYHDFGVSLQEHRGGAKMKGEA